MSTIIKFKRGSSLDVNNYIDAVAGEPVFDYESGRLFMSVGEGEELVPVDQQVYLQGYEGFEEIDYGTSSDAISFSIDSGLPSTDSTSSTGSVYVDSDTSLPYMLVSNPIDGDAVWSQLVSIVNSAGAPTSTDDDYDLGLLWVDTVTGFYYVCVDNTEGAAVWASSVGYLDIINTTTTDPTVDSDGYGLGSIWINTTTDAYFVCVDNTEGAAVWISSASSPDGVHTTITDPTVTDDSHAVGTIWINSTDDTYFVCTDASSGAAVWISSASSPDGVHTTTTDPEVTDDSYAVGTIWINSTDDTYFVCTDASSGAAVWVSPGVSSSSSGGSPYIDKRPDEMELDDTDLGVIYGSAFSLTKTVDFSPTVDGSIWFSFEIPTHFDTSSNINMRLVYSLSGEDNSKNVILVTRYWAVGANETPNIVSPAQTDQDTISSSTTQGTKIKFVLTGAVVNASDISDNDTIIVKLTRDADNASDTYLGTFQLLAVELYQE